MLKNYFEFQVISKAYLIAVETNTHLPKYSKLNSEILKTLWQKWINIIVIMKNPESFLINFREGGGVQPTVQQVKRLNFNQAFKTLALKEIRRMSREQFGASRPEECGSAMLTGKLIPVEVAHHCPETSHHCKLHVLRFQRCSDKLIDCTNWKQRV